VAGMDGCCAGGGGGGGFCAEMASAKLKIIPPMSQDFLFQNARIVVPPFSISLGFTVTGFGSTCVRCIAFSGCRSAKLLCLQGLTEKIFRSMAYPPRRGF